jgi:hypothetical protein
MRKKVRWSSAAFPKLFKAGFSRYNVTPLPENCSTSFTTGYKRLAEGGYGPFCFEALAFGFWLLEGKRIAVGEFLKRG